jgi:hypothetical protein
MGSIFMTPRFMAMRAKRYRIFHTAMGWEATSATAEDTPMGPDMEARVKRPVTMPLMESKTILMEETERNQVVFRTLPTEDSPART